MSQSHTGRRYPSSEKKPNKYQWLSTIELVDALLDRGWEYESANLSVGHYTPTQLAEYSYQYQQENYDLGPLKIHIYEDKCDGGQGYSFYHERPLTDEDREDLIARRHQILAHKDNADKELIRRFRELESRRPEWLTQQISSGEYRLDESK